MAPERARRGGELEKEEGGAGAGHSASQEAEPSRPHPAAAPPGGIAPNSAPLTPYRARACCGPST